MSRFSKILLLGSAVLVLQSCATIFSGTSQNINVQVIDSHNKAPLDGCNCVVIDGSGGQQVLTSNPGVVRVNKANGGAVQVNCHKAGYRQLNTSVGESFNGTTIVNVLFWPGFLVDVATGAHKKLPSHYVVSMEKLEKTK